MDSGAIHRSYIDKGLVDRFRVYVNSRIKSFRGWVTMGDNKTTKEVTEMLRIEVTIADSKGNPTSAEVDMVVWDMPGTGIILGFPDLVDHFLGVFIDVLVDEREAREQARAEAVSSLGESAEPGNSLREP